MTVEINNESGVAVDEATLAQLCRYVLDRMRIHPLAELSVVMLDTAAMAALHEQWMDVPGPTDVMAFPMDGGEPSLEASASEPTGPQGHGEEAGEALLGDVVLCPEVARQQAAQTGHSAEAELHLLCTHGILHLLGYDHGEPDDERAMFDLQAELVHGWAAASGRGPIRAPAPGAGGEGRG